MAAGKLICVNNESSPKPPIVQAILRLACGIISNIVIISFFFRLAMYRGDVADSRSKILFALLSGTTLRVCQEITVAIYLVLFPSNFVV